MMRSVFGVFLVVRVLATLGDAQQNQSCSAIVGGVSEILSNLNSGIDVNSTEGSLIPLCCLTAHPNVTNLTFRSGY